MSIGLRISLIIMGALLTVAGITFNQIFYNSLAGDVATYQVAYSVIGISLDVSKLITLILGAALIATGIAGFVIGGVVSLLFYFSLACISLIAGWGFSLVVAEDYEKQRTIESVQYQTNQNNLDYYSEQVNNLSQYASLNATAIQAAMSSELDKQVQNTSGVDVGTLAQRTDDCSKTDTYYYRYCNEYNELSNKLELAQQYETANAQKQLAQQEMGNMSIISNDVVHPAFVGMASLGILGNTPQLAKYRFLFISFFMIELLGAFFFAIGVLSRARAVLSMSEMQQAMQNIADTNKLFTQFQADNGLLAAQNSQHQDYLESSKK